MQIIYSYMASSIPIEYEQFLNTYGPIYRSNIDLESGP